MRRSGAYICLHARSTFASGFSPMRELGHPTVAAMCGSCANEPMVSFHPGDVVRYRAATGAPPRIGKVEELDPIWGVSVLWESGERSWFAYESWCPLQV